MTVGDNRGLQEVTKLSSSSNMGSTSPATQSTTGITHDNISLRRNMQQESRVRRTMATASSADGSITRNILPTTKSRTGMLKTAITSKAMIPQKVLAKQQRSSRGLLIHPAVQRHRTYRTLRQNGRTAFQNGRWINLKLIYWNLPKIG